MESDENSGIATARTEKDAGFLRFVLRMVTIAQAIAVALLFAAVIVAPLDVSLPLGLGAANAVLRMTLMTAVIAVARLWALNAVGAATRNGPEASEEKKHRAHAYWFRFLLFYLFLAFVNAFVWSIREPTSWGLVTGHDQPQYYAYLHSLVFDRDLDFANEFRMISGAAELTPDGTEAQAINVAPIGTAVLWLPFYLVAHATTSVLQWSGATVPADGISSPYAMGVAFGNLALAYLGTLMIFAVVRKRRSDPSAFFAVALLWLATPLIWYLLGEAWMSHACSFFAAALVLYIWDRGPRRTLKGWAGFGAAMGLAMLVRPSHVVLLVLPLADAALTGATEKKPGRAAIGAAVCLGCALAAFSLQLATWYVKHGFQLPPGSPMRWGHPAPVDVLFSSRHGLFSWHPITALGFIGLPFLWKRSRRMTICLAAVLLLYLYMNAAIASWWGGAAFGARRFVGALPFMAPGIAAFGLWAAGVCRRRPWVPAAAGVLLLGAYNYSILVQFRDHYFHPGEPVSFRRIWAGSATLFQSHFGHPFSYPANLWFAHKHDVMPAQYDILAQKEPSAFDIDAAVPDLQAYLGQGWEGPARHWFMANPRIIAVERYCTLLLPLEERETYHVTLDLGPPKGIEEKQTVSISLNDQDLYKATLQEDRINTVKFRLAGAHTKDGLNTLGLAFSEMRPVRFGARPDVLGEGLKVETGEQVQYAAVITRLTVARAEE